MWLKKKRDATGGASSAVRPSSACRILCSLLWKLALVALLIYGALHVFVRTAYFRSRVEAELSRLAGMEMRAGRIRATESLNLRIRDVISVSEFSGIEARLVRIRWHWFRPKGAPMLESVRVDGLAITIGPDENGVIQPQFFTPVAKKLLDWTGVPLPAGVVPAAPKNVAKEPDEGMGLQAFRSGGPLVMLRGVSARLQDANGNLQASVSGMDLAWASMELPNGGRVSHLDCHAAEIKVVKGPQIMGLHVELLDAGDKQFLVDLAAADWGGTSPPKPPGAEARELLDAMDPPSK
jgi:hypothetical protein